MLRDHCRWLIYLGCYVLYSMELLALVAIVGVKWNSAFARKFAGVWRMGQDAWLGALSSTIITLPTAAVVEYCNEHVCECVCVSVCLCRLSASISPEPHAWSLPIFSCVLPITVAQGKGAILGFSSPLKMHCMGHIADFPIIGWHKCD